MSRQNKEKTAKQKKSTVLVTLCILTALAFVLSTGAVSLARFVGEHNRTGTAVAAPFYFVSDSLDESCPYTQLPMPQGDTVTFSVTVSNHVDSLRCSDREIQYSYVLLSAEGDELDSATGCKLPGGTEKNQTHEFSVNRSIFETGAVTVRVTATSPYQAELSGQFGLEGYGSTGAAKTVREENGAIVLELIEPNSEVTVTWPSTLVPDPGCAYFEEIGLNATSATLSVGNTKRLALTFLKTEPTLTYTEDDFTVT